jgi:Zn-dependent protease with chaperone function
VLYFDCWLRFWSWFDRTNAFARRFAGFQGWRMAEVSAHAPRLVFVALVFVALMCVFRASSAPAQQVLPPEKVPPSFKEDALFAARIRSQLLPYTEPATGQYAVGKQVMETLLQRLPAPILPTKNAHFSWNLRIAKDAGNVFSSPDGTIFVDQSLARFLGTRAGLWAAALSHEIMHVARRDWARRYLFQKSLELAAGSQLMLGDGGVISGSWMDARGASNLLADFCRTMEVEADAEGLTLMTRAGFDPDFVPALHHLLEAQPRKSDAKVFDSFHPGWNERDERLQKLYAAAGSEYDRLWPDRYASLGGNSPLVVYAGLPSTRHDTGGELEVLIPLHCQNLIGSVEVVLRVSDSNFSGSNVGLSRELRQFTGCTSNRTLITFLLPKLAANSVANSKDRNNGPRFEAEISVLDDNGAMLTRAFAPLPVR